MLPEWPEMAIFRQKNATNFGYFPANLQKFWTIFRLIAEVWAIPLLKFWFWHFWNFFGYFWEYNLAALNATAFVNLLSHYFSHRGDVTRWILLFLSTKYATVFVTWNGQYPIHSYAQWGKKSTKNIFYYSTSMQSKHIVKTFQSVSPWPITFV